MNEKKFIENSYGLRRANFPRIVIYILNFIGVTLLILGFLSYYKHLLENEYIVIILGFIISTISIYFINRGMIRYSFINEGLLQAGFFNNTIIDWNNIVCIEVKKSLFGKEYISFILKNNHKISLEYSKDILYCLKNYYTGVNDNLIKEKI